MKGIAQTIRLRPERREEWWKLTGPRQEPWPDRGTSGQWTDIPEIWHRGDPGTDSPSQNAGGARGFRHRGAQQGKENNR